MTWLSIHKTETSLVILLMYFWCEHKYQQKITRTMFWMLKCLFLHEAYTATTYYYRLFETSATQFIRDSYLAVLCKIYNTRSHTCGTWFLLQPLCLKHYISFQQILPNLTFFKMTKTHFSRTPFCIPAYNGLTCSHMTGFNGDDR